eukprot:TRINITY_DN12969_c0_g1_i1.p2 TRINITY_DN12969_c0_g1~~TRINITY_DN12969_c0_g1_i1.p2  ORF type:complete len:141 (-),score=5.20 TRINITY_DN12969_c0_g1_i1:231-653(-)
MGVGVMSVQQPELRVGRRDGPGCGKALVLQQGAAACFRVVAWAGGTVRGATQETKASVIAQLAERPLQGHYTAKRRPSGIVACRARVLREKAQPWARKAVTWLILPVVICLSQRLSHACLSINCLYCDTANGSLNQLKFI